MGKRGIGKKKGTEIRREQERQIGVGMTTNGTGREGKRGDEYKRETEEGAHICQEVLERVVCDIMDGGSPVHGGIKRSRAIVVAS